MDDDFAINPEIRDLFKQISEHIRSRMKLIVALFIVGIAIGIPLSHSVVDWLLEIGLLPDDVNIIVLTPVEFIMLQVRIGAWLGAGLAILALIIDGAWKSGLAKKEPKTCSVCYLISYCCDFVGNYGNIVLLESSNPYVIGLFGNRCSGCWTFDRMETLIIHRLHRKPMLSLCHRLPSTFNHPIISSIWCS